ncbi:MAG: TadE/TadG family type IV pilus assembly protein [Acidobacteriaceae bacterium]
MVETAISIAILLTLLVGIMEAGLAVYSYHFISNAAREGTRYAIVRGGTWSQPPWNAGDCAAYSNSGCIASEQNVEDYVTSLAFPGINPNNITVTPTTYSISGGTKCGSYISCNAAGDVVQVKVQYAFPFSVPFVPQSTLTMSSTSQMVISQ